MSGAKDGNTRDRETITAELRLLADVRDAHRASGMEMPSLAEMDALLDELNEVARAGKHRTDLRADEQVPGRSVERG